MNGHEKGTKPSVIPVLRYRDGPVAIDWLCKTFGTGRKLWWARVHLPRP